MIWFWVELRTRRYGIFSSNTTTHKEVHAQSVIQPGQGSIPDDLISLRSYASEGIGSIAPEVPEGPGFSDEESSDSVIEIDDKARCNWFLVSRPAEIREKKSLVRYQAITINNPPP